MKRICVYCGSRNGKNPAYVESAMELGRILAERNIGLVYGGASIGVMSAVADSVLKHGGEVIGVLPKMLTHKEIAHSKLSQLIIVDSMHTRKQKMFELSDAFIALPGGLGTFEELCEILTWQQLGTHQRPTGVLNVAGYYDHMLKMFDHATQEEFMSADHRRMVLSASTPQELLKMFESYVPPELPFWVSKEQT